MITSLYAGLLALVYIALSVNVIVRRYQVKSAIGDADDFEMKRRIRAHANFVEYTPLFLILMILAEMQGLEHVYVHSLGGAFLIGRILHAFSMTKLEKYENGKILVYPVFRSIGMVTTFTSIAILAVFLIVKGL